MKAEYARKAARSFSRLREKTVKLYRLRDFCGEKSIGTKIANLAQGGIVSTFFWGASAMRYVLSLGFLSVIGLSATTVAQGTKDEKCDNVSFVKMASCGNLSEIKMGKLAQESATNSEVKAFASRMVKDHTKAQEELKEACKTSKTECPDKQTKEGKEACEKCEKLKSSKDFDAGYIAIQIECHEKALKLYERASKECECDMLKAYAKDHIPAIRQHLAAAKNIQKSLGVKASD
jgi:putative membrane protein